MNKFFLYFYLRGVNVTTLTKTDISCLEIIVQGRPQALSTHLEMLYTTRNLRTLVDSVVSICRGTLRCLGATLVHNCPDCLACYLDIRFE